MTQAHEEGGELDPIPDGLVVLTFDDGAKSNGTFVGPLLLRYGFGATFFITEGLNFRENKQYYMTWDEIRELHAAGFEIGNHLGRHVDMRKHSREEIEADVAQIEQRCREHGIPVPRSFAYPGGHNSPEAVEVLAQAGYLFARRGCEPLTVSVDYEWGGRGPAYEPQRDHPLLIPLTGNAGPHWTFDDLVWTVEQARDGKIAVLTFHGVPDLDHLHCSVEPEVFAAYMDYLRDNNCTVIATRDLVRYVDPIQPFPKDLDFSAVNDPNC